MVENEKILNSEEILNAFGLNSGIFKDGMNFLEKEAKIKKEKFKRKFKIWESIYKNIYGEQSDYILFLKHSYFALILKILILSKFLIVNNKSIEEVYQYIKSTNLDSLNILEFEKFNWTNFNRAIFTKIYNFIEKAQFAQEDLFHSLYQQIFLTLTRHKIGEYYTLPNLVKKMVEDFYKFGLKILDPSCGSGSFLIEIIINILNSKSSETSKIKAVNNVYGFDINPLATLTAKVNIFLLILDYFNMNSKNFPKVNIFLVDSLFPEQYEKKVKIDLKALYNNFDLIIGNPPWITYKDIYKKGYQIKIRELSNIIGIKPPSQYITHIELAAIFFYAIPLKFLKINGKIFFVITKSVLNGGHCFKFRGFSVFNNLEIWDFPNSYFFNVNHICLKAEYIGKYNKISINEKYPIKTKIFNEKIEKLEETHYSSFKIENNGAKLLLPQKELKLIKKISKSEYRDKFFQGATLVPRTLVFFEIKEKKNGTIVISSDLDTLSRAKNRWKFTYENKEIEKNFRYKTFLNRDLIPFCIKKLKNVFLPINEKFDFEKKFLQQYPNAFSFYKEMNLYYQTHKKETSSINTLFANLNYWNKLKKQINNKDYVVVYNASGSNVKAAVITNKRQKVIIGSENYYYSTESEDEAYYLSALLNTPKLSKYIKLIKSSRHIHKRPFIFPIPYYDESNENHRLLAKFGKENHAFVEELVRNNPSITSEKVRIFLHQKLMELDRLTEEIVFQQEKI
ncbi:MAG: Eco57I restriction-modification methylase domain-containing protein [Promethearchaeota archaeon]